MAAASLPRSSFRTAEYWAALEAVADGLINHAADDAARRSWDAPGTLRRLSSRGFGPVSLFDLCALLVLAAPRLATEPAVPAAGAPGVPPHVAPPPVTAPIAEVKRGPVTVAAHPTDRNVKHLQELEDAVAEALLVDPQHPRARDAARRALMARGRTVQDATAVYGIVCELFPPAAT
ncbi:hypothetical protein K388_05975 [Streptomyces sp. KhCrAH-43]|uniref:hypothetical protein n=1 Tax=unclassified Streptomyces TaxID=2593676 RepID=UPI00036A0055|nr:MULTISPECIES: hypothetical protein [unclassified Streptomyces]MYS33633.1 hypothetical protein [Streptomyces sp. SID4920]MYX63774.1 hypothetical protein [Streptomyces sp. SID8373]RAJ52875.1 hypothetical protein K388_05975 [Streptomyces sp. KhCrAH-43]